MSVEKSFIGLKVMAKCILHKRGAYEYLSIHIPKILQDIMSLKPGDYLVFEFTEHGIVVKKHVRGGEDERE